MDGKREILKICLNGIGMGGEVLTLNCMWFQNLKPDALEINERSLLSVLL